MASRTGANPFAPRSVLRLVGVGAGLAVILAIGACHKSALRPDDTRSQFDRYDATRNERAPAFVEDAFGRRQPNLRGRLLGND